MTGKAPDTRSAGQVEGTVALDGIARTALAERPGSFVPDNDPVKNAFFWKHLPDLARGLPEADLAGLLPFVVDAGPMPRPARAVRWAARRSSTFPTAICNMP